MFVNKGEPSELMILLRSKLLGRVAFEIFELVLIDLFLKPFASLKILFDIYIISLYLKDY
jgi:hypothetical protein